MTTNPKGFREASRKFKNQVENIFYTTSVDVRRVPLHEGGRG